MSVWMLLIFAVSMLSAVLAFDTPPPWSGIARLVFGLTLALFFAGLLLRGIRRPVV